MLNFLSQHKPKEAVVLHVSDYFKITVLNCLYRLDGRNPSPPLLCHLQPPQSSLCHLHRRIKKVLRPKRSKPAHHRWRKPSTLLISKLAPLLAFEVIQQEPVMDGVFTLYICVALVWQGAVRGVLWGTLCWAARVSAWGGSAFAYPTESGHFTSCYFGQLSPKEEELDRSHLQERCYETLAECM